MSRHEVLDPKIKSVPPGLCALGIMTKVPQAGKVKTRLSPPLTPQEAAALNRCFLQDLGRSISTAGKESAARGVGVYTPIGLESAYENVLPDNFALIPQHGDGFGERLIQAAHDLFEVGFDNVCLINSDSPTVPAASFAEAAVELAKPGDRIVLGPSDDGGYYLIGLKGLHGRVFEDIEWSTERVLPQTKERAAELGIAVHELPTGFDVDDRLTLRRLCDELLGGKAEARDIAPNTRTFLSDIVSGEGRGRIWPKL